MVREGGVELPKAPSEPLFVTKVCDHDRLRRSVQLGRMRVPDAYDADAGITNP